MEAKANQLTITLDGNEIMDFWNIVMFALDYHNKETKQGKPCMHENELKLANELVEITENIK